MRRREQRAAPPAAAPPCASSTTKPRVIRSGVAFERPGLPADGHDRHDQPVARQVPAVAEHLVADFAGAGAVDQHAAGRHLAPPPGRPRRRNGGRRRSPRSGPWSAADDPGRPSRACRASCRYSPCIGTKYRGLTSDSMSFSSSSLPWPDTCTCLLPSVDDVGAAAGDVVHHPADRFFVAGDGPRREHDDVAGASLTWRWSSMAIRGRAAMRLALRARAQADDVLRRRSLRHRCRESARRPAAAGSRAAGRSASSDACRGRRTPPCGRTAPPGRRRSAGGRCSTRTSRRRSCPSALVKISSKASTTSRSEPVKPRRSALVLSEKQRQHARGAELARSGAGRSARRRAASDRS